MTTFLRSAGVVLAVAAMSLCARAQAESEPDRGTATAQEVRPVVAPEPAAVEKVTLPSDHEIYVTAIQERRVLQFNYGGHVRVCEPHSYGVGSSGAPILHVYQTAGSSGSKPPPGWRTFTITGISDLVLTQRKFKGPRADYSDQKPELSPTWAELASAE